MSEFNLDALRKEAIKTSQDNVKKSDIVLRHGELFGTPVVSEWYVLEDPTTSNDHHYHFRQIIGGVAQGAVVKVKELLEGEWELTVKNIDVVVATPSKFHMNQKLQHLKSGGVYEVVCLPQFGMLEATREPAYSYKAWPNGKMIYHRCQTEMEDGRFVPYAEPTEAIHH